MCIRDRGVAEPAPRQPPPPPPPRPPWTPCPGETPPAARWCKRQPTRGKPLVRSWARISPPLSRSPCLAAGSATKLRQVIDTLQEHIIPLSATDATDVIKLHNHRLCTNTSIFLQTDLHIFFHPLCMNSPAVHKGTYFRTHYVTLALQYSALHNVITIDSLNLPPFPLIRTDFAERDYQCALLGSL